MKKIIIFTSRGGEGLISGSKAISEALQQLYQTDVDVSIIDFFEKFGSIGKPFTAFYNKLLRKSIWLNSLYVKILHFLRLDKWQILYSKIHPKFKEFIEKEKPDGIVITSQYIVSYLSCYKEKYRLNAKIFVGNIDPGTSCVPLWFGKNIDKHLIPTPECFVAYQRMGNSPEKALCAKLVVRSQFKEVLGLSKDELRKRLSLPLDVFIVLFSGSREGLEEFFPLIKQVIKETSVFCVVLCGSNESLRLKLLSLPQSQVRGVGWTDTVSEYFRASDLVVSKPGKQTMKEAISTHLPMISLCYPSVMDQEKGNLEYMHNRKILLKGESRNSIIEYIKDFSSNSNLYQLHVDKLRDVSTEIDPQYVARLIWQEIK